MIAKPPILSIALLLILPLTSNSAWAQEATPPSTGDLSAAAYEPPYDRAEVLEGMGKAHFPILSSVPGAQEFFDQGIAQLHAGADFEAERSFRQVTTLDPDCGTAYWGMAMANPRNASRALEFAWEAYSRRDRCGAYGRRYIETYARFLGADHEPEWEIVDAESGRRRAIAQPPSSERRERLRGDLIAISAAHPKDIEARAFLLREWSFDSMRPAPDDRKRIDADLRAIAILAPRHPARRYAVELYEDLPAAGLGHHSTPSCGASAPAMGRMWEADGALFARIGRFDDAAEAFRRSEQSDRALMDRTGAFPFEIEGYVRAAGRRARSLIRAGRFREAIVIARSLIDLPRHPRHRRHASEAGKELWVEALKESERWPRLIEVLRRPGFSYADSFGHHAMARAFIDARATGSGPSKGLATTGLSADLAALLHLRNGKVETALEVMAALPVKSALPRLARRIWIEWKAGRRDDARMHFVRLRLLAKGLDIEAPPFARLADVAASLRFPKDWRKSATSRAEEREWSPALAPVLNLPVGKGGEFSLSDRKGRPTLVVFYLGFGCVHCVEQLHAIRPRVDEFRRAGVDIVTVGIDSVAEVKASFQMQIENDTPQMPFPVLCDPRAEAFKAWRCWDHFKDEALHGTFIVDGQGRLRWRDVSVEPFMATDFLIEECRRLVGG